MPSGLMQKDVVGWTGLGNMGLPMATNLQEYLTKQFENGAFAPSLFVHNRTLSKADPLIEKGATKAESIEVLANKCTIVFSMLLNDEAVAKAVDAFLASTPKPGSIWVDCSTVYPGLSEELAAKAKSAGVYYLAAPIFGRPKAIAGHSGICTCSGEAIARERVKPLLEHIGQGVLDCGDAVCAANVMKLVGNFFIISFNELIAEGMTLGEKNGISRAHTAAFLEKFFPGPFTKVYTDAITHDQFEPDPNNPGFNIEGGMKDAKHMQTLGRETGAPLPVVDVMLEHMEEVRQMGGGDLDFAALALAVRKQAGLPLSHLQ